MSRQHCNSLMPHLLLSKLGCHAHLACQVQEHKVPGVVQFSLLNGSIHDSWLQQGHEGVRMDEDIRARCEVLACQRPPPPAEGARKKAPKSTEVN